MSDITIPRPGFASGPAPGPLLPVVGGAGLTDEPHLRALAEDIAASVRCSFTMAAAGTSITRPGAVDTTIADFLSTRSDAARAVYRANATTRLASPATSRRSSLGRFAALSQRDYARVGSDGLDSVTPALRIDHNAFRTALASAAEKPKQRPRLKLSKDVVEGLRYRKLRLYLKEVRCLETTSGPGDDEINIGGTVISASGETSIIDQFVVSDDFEDGDMASYPSLFKFLDPAHLLDPDKIKQAKVKAENAPGRVFAEWDIRTDLGWPAAYAATVAMAEKDDGGFWTFLKELAKKIIAEIEKALGKSLGTAVGAAIGSAFGPGWGTVIGGVIGFIIGAALDELLGNNADDVLGVANLTMSFGAATKSYYDWTKLLATPHPATFPLDFNGDGGHYRARMYYQVSED